MEVKLISYNPAAEFICGKAAAKCYSGKKPSKSLETAMSGGHESVLEHVSFTFEVDGVSRVLLAQLTRHRLASYSVQSQRYCGANHKLVTPPSMNGKGLDEDIRAVEEAVRSLYGKAVAAGVPMEDARDYTFQAETTGLILTMNARELRHFFSLRCCRRAQWEIRRLADEMLKLCRNVAPTLFADAGPGCVRGGCPEGKKSCGAPREELRSHG